jgi:hypothetical protein
MPPINSPFQTYSMRKIGSNLLVTSSMSQLNINFVCKESGVLFCKMKTSSIDSAIRFDINGIDTNGQVASETITATIGSDELVGTVIFKEINTIDILYFGSGQPKIDRLSIIENIPTGLNEICGNTQPAGSINVTAPGLYTYSLVPQNITNRNILFTCYGYQTANVAGNLILDVQYKDASGTTNNQNKFFSPDMAFTANNLFSFFVDDTISELISVNIIAPTGIPQSFGIEIRPYDYDLDNKFDQLNIDIINFEQSYNCANGNPILAGSFGTCLGTYYVKTESVDYIPFLKTNKRDQNTAVDFYIVEDSQAWSGQIGSIDSINFASPAKEYTLELSEIGGSVAGYIDMTLSKLKPVVPQHQCMRIQDNILNVTCIILNENEDTYFCTDWYSDTSLDFCELIKEENAISGITVLFNKSDLFSQSNRYTLSQLN